MTADYDQAARNHTVDLLFVDGRLAGVIELVVEPECVLIENVAVRPDQAGKAHRQALMANAIEVGERDRSCR